MQFDTRPDLEDLSDKQAMVLRVLANGAFVDRMLRAIARGREGAIPGTFVDTTPINTRRFRPEPVMSPCGSPAAMCAEGGS